MRRSAHFFAVFALLALAGCAGTVTKGPGVDKDALAKEAALQQQMVFERAMKDEARVYSLAFPLLGANTEFCGSYTRPVVGLSAWNIHSVSNTYRPAAKKLYGLDDRQFAGFYPSFGVWRRQLRNFRATVISRI